MYTYGIFKHLIFNKKVAVVWPLLESHQIYQDVKDKLQHLILQVANRRKQNVHNVLNLTHAQNANTGQFIPAIPQRFFSYPTIRKTQKNQKMSKAFFEIFLEIDSTKSY